MLKLKFAATFILMACASSNPKIKISCISGEKVDKIRYEPFEELEAILINNVKDEIEVEVEKKILPRGGRLHIKNSVHRSKRGTKSEPNHIISSVIVKKGNVTFVCDEPDIRVTEYHNSMPSSQPFSYIYFTEGRNEKSIINCAIDKKIEYPFEVYILGYTGDTTSVYMVEHK